MMKVGVLSYNAGNIQSVVFALRRLGVEPLVSNQPAELELADRLIFPGVGEASSAMAFLRKHRLDSWLRTYPRPLLGICLGLQLLCEHSEENDTPGLGIFPVQVRRFPPGEKVPHMGWNTITRLKGPLFQHIPEESYLYFLHSYYAEENPWCIAHSRHGIPFCAAMRRENFFAVQFHPEKSGPIGSRLLQNFLELPC